MNKLTNWIDAELRQDGMRLAEEGEQGRWEDSSIGLVEAIDLPLSPEAAEAARTYEAGAIAARAQSVSAQMIADTWQDDNGPQRVATILRSLPFEQRERLAREYWNLLRQRGHGASLVEVGIQFCVVERLAA